MPEFIYHLASVPLFMFLSGTLIFIAVITISLAYHYVPLHFRYQENTAIISCSAFLGVTYAILIGFTILYELNVFEKVDRAETMEGKVLYSIYLHAQTLPPAAATKIRQLTIAYAKNAIEHEWPTMAADKEIDSTGKNIIEKIMHEKNAIKFSNTMSSAAINDLNNIAIAANTLFELHHERVVKAHPTLNRHIWFVLLITTILTLGINCLLGMEYVLHLICIIFISVMIAAIMYLIISLDRPYQGDFAVRPDSITSTLEYIS